jgi:hypothetical protein
MTLSVTPVEAISEISDSNDGSVKMIAFWDMVPCSLVEVNRRFRGA